MTQLDVRETEDGNHPVVKVLVAILAVLVIVVGAAVVIGSRKPAGPERIVGEPLLHNPLARGEAFRDDYERFRFIPPPDWSLQAKSMPAPGKEKDDRILAKFKNLVQDTTTSWMTVRVCNLPPNLTLAECLAKKAPGEDWKQISATQEFDLHGVPAARAIYGGKFDKYDFVRETVAVRKRDRTYLISGVHYAPDSKSRDLIRASMLTCQWDD